MSRAGREASATEALAAIPDRARVYVSPFCGTPMQLLEVLDEMRDRWSALEIVVGALFTSIGPQRHPGAPFRFTTWQMSGPCAPALEAGALEVLPVRYSQAPRIFGAGGAHAVDVALVQVSPPGPDGRVSLGTSVGAVVDVVRSAPLVIAQVNPQMPYTFGAGELPREAFDYLVRLEGPLPEAPPVRAGDVEAAIATHVRALVPEGATLQIGIGAVPDAVLRALEDSRDLGVHSGLISDAVIDLVEHGVITNTRKAFDQDALVCAEVIGTRRLFDWVHRNPRVRVEAASHTHNVDVLRRLSTFRAINSAVEVAMDGTVNAESVGGRLISGPGGQPDFAEGGLWADGAMSIIALPATASGGAASRIVRRIEGDAVVTLPRSLADRVVTEHGVAALRGATLAERASRLRAIAAPAFRANLEG